MEASRLMRRESQAEGPARNTAWPGEQARCAPGREER